MAKKLDMRSPFPDPKLPLLDASGRLERVWFEFLLKQFQRTGNEPGGDLIDVTQRVRDLEMMVNADPAAAFIAALVERVAVLEALVLSMPAPVPHREPVEPLPGVVPTVPRAATAVPDPVAVPPRAAATLPEPVPVAQRVPDDIRKLIEA
ncbi:hypothetical protein DF107_18170 [Burkholderia stagnalis]|uniref:hypothetical protein n=1 Tax=Burkholderia stagnalis TaxID=1503054 RepID=UPI000F5A43B5|nr:hypothetical protein [Burkholderia stagnalis]RQQ19729.1 hypothetical protein DF161_07095 [Burkholderia stagnalis]RQY67278.1 hypothetical protein DF109_07985 [Burkholderia stagnalis]RQY80043.1 hypothetical protein DF107_18170 [Burkholderia stagnalis]